MVDSAAFGGGLLQFRNIKTVHKDGNGIDGTGVIVRLFNGTPQD